MQNSKPAITELFDKASALGSIDHQFVSTNGKTQDEVRL